tara:strand:- start:110 stop:619 length:510 start_codon:yes stop_codon:yes gene_type:complete
MNFKNKISISILFLMSTFLSFAQNDIEGGVRLSLNLPSSSEASIDGLTDISLGYFETMYLSENFALQGEINFSRFKFEQKFGEGEGENVSTQEYDLSLIEIPLLAKYVINDFHIAGGIQFTDFTSWLPVIDLSYNVDKFRFNARYISYGDELGYEGLSNISFGVGYIIL